MLAGRNQVRNLIFFHNFIKNFLGSDLLPSQSDAVLKQRRKKKIAETQIYDSKASIDFPQKYCQ